MSFLHSMLLLSYILLSFAPLLALYLGNVLRFRSRFSVSLMPCPLNVYIYILRRYLQCIRMVAIVLDRCTVVVKPLLVIGWRLGKTLYRFDLSLVSDNLVLNIVCGNK